MFFVPEGSGKSAEKRENRRDFPWLSVVRDSQFVQNANPHYPRDSALFGDTAQPDSALSWTALSLTLFFHCMFNFWSTGCTFTKVHKIFLWCQMGRIKKMLQIPKNVVKILRLCSKISGNLCAIKSACRWKEKICDFPCTQVKVSHQLPKGKHLHANFAKTMEFPTDNQDVLPADDFATSSMRPLRCNWARNVKRPGPSTREFMDFWASFQGFKLTSTRTRSAELNFVYWNVNRISVESDSVRSSPIGIERVQVLRCIAVVCNPEQTIWKFSFWDIIFVGEKLHFTYF